MRNLLKINDVAELVGVSVQTIRRMEANQICDPPRRDSSGRRYYTLDDAQRIFFARRPEELGVEIFTENWKAWEDRKDAEEAARKKPA